MFLALVLGLPAGRFRFPRRFGDLLDVLEQQRIDITRLTQILLFTGGSAATAARPP